MRLILASALLPLVAANLRATTLEQLTLDQMIQQSTAIVHVKVTSSSPAMRGRNVYTFYQLQTIETLKGAAATEVAVPGGSTAMIRQEVAGAPMLASGGEYVIFLWSGSSALMQVIGLSQGLFKVAEDSSGNPVLVRAALSGVNVVNKSGQAQTPATVTITLAALKDEIRKAMGAK